MAGFVKIYGSIIRSTVWQQPATTKLVWLTMLILADHRGKVEASIPGLAATAGVTLEECEAALTCFLSPDKYSHSKVDGGRRIRECFGGWTITNHEFYRDLRTPKQIADADRIAAKRAARDTLTTVATGATCRVVATDRDRDREEDKSTSSSAPPAPSPDQPLPLDAPRAQPEPTASAPADAVRVFDHWRAKLEHPRAKLDPKRTRLIRDRLKQFSADDLCRAVDGCARSDFHMGKHPKTQGQRHDAIELICRDAAHVEKFLELAERPSTNGGTPFDKEVFL